jgi:hypothetical protein
VKNNEDWKPPRKNWLGIPWKVVEIVHIYYEQQPFNKRLKKACYIPIKRIRIGIAAPGLCYGKLPIPEKYAEANKNGPVIIWIDNIDGFTTLRQRRRIAKQIVERHNNNNE